MRLGSRDVAIPATAQLRDPGDEHHVVRRRVDDVLAQELERRRGVLAESAAQLGSRPDPRRGRDRQRARGADERAPGEHLNPVRDQPSVLADSRAAGAAELDVGLAAIAGVWSKKGDNPDSRVTAERAVAIEEDRP
jgi:hypothetical protein